MGQDRKIEGRRQPRLIEGDLLMGLTGSDPRGDLQNLLEAVQM